MAGRKFTITIIRGLILACLLAFLGTFVARFVDFTRTDIGRHLKNGELILSALSSRSGFPKNALNTNCYSYTNPEYPVINHHWGSGVIFSCVYSYGGVRALSALNIVLTLAAFLFFFDAAIKKSDFYACAFLAAFLIPLIAERKEIRPEAFSYLFAGIFYWTLENCKNGRVKYLWVFALPLVQLVWANTHIYFVFGLFIAGCFLAEEIISKGPKRKELSAVFAACAVASIVTPFGVKGLLYPFNIFRNYGYKLVENQSVGFLENYGIINTNFMVYKISAGLLALSFIIILISDFKKFPAADFAIGSVFAVMAYLALRNFTLFGLFALPIIAGNIRLGLTTIDLNSKSARTFFAALALIALIFGFTRNYASADMFMESVRVGLAPGNDTSARFFIQQNIKGPVFNNYDIGSYLIFHLFPRERVFTDNRPEAYPETFFNDIYIPMQENPVIFAEQDKIYGFNTVFFSYHDLTPWGQAFLLRIIDDKGWAPVFVDNYAIIFLKRNMANKPIIDKYMLPRGMFSVKKNG